MATFNKNFIPATFNGLLQVPGGLGLTNTSIQDGLGTTAPFRMSTTTFGITGTFALPNVADGTLQVVGGVVSSVGGGGGTTFASLSGTLLPSQMVALTGDVTTTTGSAATTLATVNSNVGSFGDGSHTLSITVNGKGLITAASTNNITGSTSLTTVGTVTTGTWTATAIDATHGGTAQTTWTTGDTLYASASNTLSKLAGNTTATRNFLRQTGNGSVSAAPAWDTVTKTDVGLANVENTALSTWAGSTNVTTLGTITTGTWNGNKITEGFGGTNQATYTLGDTLYSSATNTLSKLAGNTTTTRNFLRQTGNGSVSAAPAWDTVTKTDVGLSNVENTALSTWAGSTNITTLGTITTGTWNATKINPTYTVDRDTVAYTYFGGL